MSRDRAAIPVTSPEADSGDDVRPGTEEVALNALRAIAGHVDATCDLSSFFGLLSETVAGLVRARRAAFWRLDPANTLVVQPGSYGFAPGVLETVCMPLDPNGHGKPERVVFHDDVQTGSLGTSEFDAYRAVLDRMGVRNSVAVSWRVGSTILGGLAAYDADRDFDEHDVWVLRIAAATAGLVWQCKLAEAELRDTATRFEAVAEERRRLFQHLVIGNDAERRRLANDIHDDALQALTAVDLRLHRLRERMEHPGPLRLLEDATDMLARADTSLRRLLFDVGPPSLELPGGLEETVRSRLEHLASITSIRPDLDIVLHRELTGDTARTLFRILHGALTNVARHSGASSVHVVIHDDGHGIQSRVIDDGTGFAGSLHPEQPGHVGIAVMQQRAEQAGGWLRVDTSAGEGTSVSFWLPYETP